MSARAARADEAEDRVVGVASLEGRRRRAGRGLGVRTVVLDADPDAEPFYEAVTAVAAS